MARASPQTDRVVQVIELLSQGDAGATLTEIARALGLHPSSCVPFLATLTSAGFVAREPDRRYHLGPALARPGRLAAARYPSLVAARDEMAALSVELGAACFAFAPEGDHARLAQATAAPGEPPLPMRLGETVPLTPPLGIIFVAWGTEAEFDAWLALDPGLGPARAGPYRERRAAIRDLGFVAELAPPSRRQARLAGVMDDRASPHRDGQLHSLLAGDREAPDEPYLLTTFGDERPRPVAGIGAPVFDAAGKVVLSLTMVAFPEPIAPARIAHLGEIVRRAAERVTAALR